MDNSAMVMVAGGAVGVFTLGLISGIILGKYAIEKELGILLDRATILHRAKGVISPMDTPFARRIGMEFPPPRGVPGLDAPFAIPDKNELMNDNGGIFKALIWAIPLGIFMWGLIFWLGAKWLS
jgi:hypothetical protein